ncbi:MAG: hypothetical protein KatS3mg086_194 [Candidatus Dojkabacteria bacterium]|nr:MAG: hypothetical protein KatS3mg086_194 [Candidatus Dojkabacteria bacterium]
MSLQNLTLESLFVSKVRIKALKFFMLNPSREIHLRGAVRAFEEEINAVRREFSRLEKVQLITSDTKGNRLYFKLNLSHPFINELMSFFHKSYGLGGEIIEMQEKLGDVAFALLTPAFTRGMYFGDQIIDLFVVGKINLKELQKIIHHHEDEIGREINYTVIDENEFKLRKRRGDQFINNIMIQDNVLLIGRHEDLIR